METKITVSAYRILASFDLTSSIKLSEAKIGQETLVIDSRASVGESTKACQHCNLQLIRNVPEVWISCSYSSYACRSDQAAQDRLE